jgi:hypothetical protein
MPAEATFAYLAGELQFCALTPIIPRGGFAGGHTSSVQIVQMSLMRQTYWRL